MAIGSAYKPLLWILFLPIITVPATLWLTPPGGPLGVCRNVERDFIGGSAFCPTGSLLLALSPGLLNLVPILWLSSRNQETRRAALAATILGGLRLVVPAVAVLASSTDGYNRIIWGFTAGPNSDSPDVSMIGVFLWVVTLVTLVVMRRRARSRKIASDAEAAGW